MYRLLETSRRTKLPNKLKWCAHLVDRRDLQYAQVSQIDNALILVLVE
jgi:hypothetical protein